MNIKEFRFTMNNMYMVREIWKKWLVEDHMLQRYLIFNWLLFIYCLCQGTSTTNRWQPQQISFVLHEKRAVKKTSCFSSFPVQAHIWYCDVYTDGPDLSLKSFFQGYLLTGSDFTQNYNALCVYVREICFSLYLAT